MKTAGIVAEYNPFHNGHAYQLQRTRELTGADFCVVVLSGDFTQRGTPGMFDKYVRAEMALRGGADLVLELPACYACGSAEYFAQGAVTLLHKLGAVDFLSFGSECGNVEPLQRAAAMLTDEPESYRRSLKALLREGVSFPAARAQALADCIDPLLFSSPNNILGLEYCKALYRLRSPVQPVTVPRAGSGYHETNLNADGYSSASAVREALLADQPPCVPNTPRGRVPESLRGCVPDAVYSVLQQALGTNAPITANDFSSLLHYQLLREEPAGFTAYLDVSRALSDKIVKCLPEYESFDGLCTKIKSKELTYTRVSRALCHILTGLKAETMERYRSGGSIFYARILGFRREASPLLSAIKKRASIPLLSKSADANSVLSAFYEKAGQPQDAILAAGMFSYDVLCSHLYQTAAAQKFGADVFKNEYKQQIVIPKSDFSL